MKTSQNTFTSALVSTLVLLVACTTSFAQGVGIHVNLRSTANPSPGSYHYSDVVAEGNYAYISSWHNTAGVWIFDVSNPDAAKYVARFAPTGSTNMQGIEVVNGIGYFADDNGGGIFIVDLSNPLKPVIISKITSTQLGQNNVHDITLDASGHHLFVPGYPNNSNVQIWNVSNPNAPFWMMTLKGSDPVAVHDVTVYNNRLFMAGWGSSSTGESSDIWDITNIDTQAPVLLGSFISGVHTQDVSVSGDSNYVFCPRELASNGDVGVFNISNPASVVKVADITEPGWGIAATSPSTSKIMGNYLYVAWYQAGLLVFDISDPTNPIMVGSYDTWPGFSYGGNGGGDGDWGVWPFLGADRVLLSDRNTGLYVLDTSGVNAQAAVYNVLFNPSSLLGSTPTQGSAYLLGLAPAGGLNVNMSSNSPALTPSAQFFSAGTHSTTFQQPTSSVTSTTVVTVTATEGAYSANGTVTLTPPQPSAVSASPVPILGGLSLTGKVTLNAPTAADTNVALNVLNGAAAIASMPNSVTVPAGQTTATWTINTAQVTKTTSVKISATLNGLTKYFSFSVKAITPSRLSFSPNPVTGGSSTTGTVTFSEALANDTVVTLTVVSGGSAVASIPPSITVPAGSSTGTFKVVTNTVSVATTVKISASANGGTVFNTFKVN